MKRRLGAFLAVIALLAAACGQYENVHEQAFGSGSGGRGGSGSLDGGSGGLDGGSGGLDGGSGGLDGGGSGGLDGGGSGGLNGGGSGGSGGGGTGGGSGGGSGGGAGDTTGVTDSTITIGIHAPLTGAAPLKSSSFNIGKDLYWKRGANGKPVTIHGRQVKVVFNDDQYNPSRARLVCQEMAQRDKTFLLIGGAGTDQIQACAQFAASRGIPYLSAGVTEIGMRNLSNYFAISESYAQQGPQLAQYIRKVLKVTDPKRVAVVMTDTANFDDALQSFTKAYPGVKVFRPNKNERGSSMAGNLCTGTVKNYDVVYPLTAPTYYLEMAKAAKCLPQYAGVGVSMGIDTVASTGCEGDVATEGARFFSPVPAFQDSDKFDPQFRKAAQQEGVTADDVMFLLWGLSKSLHALLDNAGPNLTRQQFISATSTAKAKTGVFPDLSYSPQDHYGARQVHVLRNVCARRGSQAGYYVTEASFKTGF